MIEDCIARLEPLLFPVRCEKLLIVRNLSSRANCVMQGSSKVASTGERRVSFLCSIK